MKFTEQDLENYAQPLSDTEIEKCKNAIRMVRIMKKIRYIMQDNGYSSSNKVSSFGLESLLWNIPDSIFAKYTSYRFVFDELIKYAKKEDISNFKEANGIKDLFPNQQTLNDYKEFISDINNFFEYDI